MYAIAPTLMEIIITISGRSFYILIMNLERKVFQKLWYLCGVTKILAIKLWAQFDEKSK